MWGADAFGGNGTGSDLCVTDGRFANMTLHIGPGDEDTEYCLRRAWDNENAIANANSTMLYMCNSYNTYLLAMVGLHLEYPAQGGSYLYRGCGESSVP